MVLCARLAVPPVVFRKRKPTREVYVRPRYGLWLEEFAYGLYDDGTWRRFFRVGKETFSWLCEKLRSRLQCDGCPAQLPVSVEKKIALTLLRLSQPTGNWVSCADKIGMGASTGCNHFWIVINAIVDLLSYKISFPSTLQGLQPIIDGFFAKHAIPNLAGAIDCTHVFINRPFRGMDGQCYMDRNNNFSIVAQAVVDSRLRFTDVFVGSAGSCHDARILNNSPFKLAVEDKRILQGDLVTVGDTTFGPFILGDAGYPLLPWLITPLPTMPTAADRLYNNKQSSARIVVERAFGRVKCVWRILTSRVGHDLARVPRIVLACFILQNIMIDHNDEVDTSVYNEAQVDLDIRAGTGVASANFNTGEQRIDPNPTGKAIQEALKQLFVENEAAKRSKFFYPKY